MGPEFDMRRAWWWLVVPDAWSWHQGYQLTPLVVPPPSSAALGGSIVTVRPTQRAGSEEGEGASVCDPRLLRSVTSWQPGHMLL